MNPAAHDILGLTIDGLVAAAVVGLLAYYVLRARKRTAAVKEEQRQAAEMLDIAPPEDPR
jgi:hypothetical protein